MATLSRCIQAFSPLTWQPVYCLQGGRAWFSGEPPHRSRGLVSLATFCPGMCQPRALPAPALITGLGCQVGLHGFVCSFGI